MVNGEAQVSAAIDRPLLHARPWTWCDMYNLHSLAKEGFEVEGNCVAHQLELLVRKNAKPLWSRESLEEQIDEAQSELYGDGEPYWDEDSQSLLDWRTVGVTARMVMQLCRRHEIPVQVLWHNSVVESYTPSTRNHNNSNQALHIAGNHAFFYADPHTKAWVARRSLETPGARPSEAMQLAHRPPETTLCDWEPLPEVIEGLEGHFYLVGESAMLKARVEFHKLRICPKVSLGGPCSQNIRCLTVKTPGKKEGASIHCIHSDHAVCGAFVDLVNKQTDGSLLYSGQSPGATMATAFEELTRPTKRVELSQELRAQIVQRQQGLCADCGDELKAPELDHRTPLCFGGSNEPENLAALCKACHAQKSYFESVGTVEDRNPLVSRFNRETHRLFAMARKPPQLVANLHEPQSNQVTVQADVIRCRYTQFLENVHDIPVFCALDDIVETVPGHLGD